MVHLVERQITWPVERQTLPVVLHLLQRLDDVLFSDPGAVCDFPTLNLATSHRWSRAVQ